MAQRTVGIHGDQDHFDAIFTIFGHQRFVEIPAADGKNHNHISLLQHPLIAGHPGIVPQHVAVHAELVQPESQLLGRNRRVV